MNFKSSFSKPTYPSGTLENALHLVPYPILKVEGNELRITYANDALLEIWAKDISILGQTIHQIQPELFSPSFSPSLRRVLETGEAQIDQEAVLKLVKNGISETVYFDYSYTAIKSEEGEITGVIIVCKDVTEQVLAKRKLRASEERFRSMVLQAPFAIAVLQCPEFVIESANSQSLDIWGRTTDVIGKKVVDVFPELVEQGFIDLLKRVNETAEPFFGNEVPVQLVKSGKVTDSFLNFVYHPVIENGHVSLILSVGYDVTELVNSRKRAELKKNLLEYLNTAGEELALTLDTNSALKKISKLIVPTFADWFTINVLKGDNLEILMVIHEDENYVNWAKEYRLKNPVTIHDQGPQGHILRTGESLMIPVVTNEMLEASMKDREHLEIIKKMNLRSSIVVPMKIGNKVIGTVNFLSTIDGKEYNQTDLNFAKDFATRIALALENARLHEDAQKEIEERKKIEIALRDEEEQFRNLSDAIPQLAWMADKEGWIFWYNQRWYDYTGTTFEEMQGWGWEKVHHPDFKEGIIEFCKKAWPKGEPFELDFPLKSKDGEWRWFLTRAVPIFDSKGELCRWFGTNTDITEQREALELNKKLLGEMEFERNRFEAVVTQMPGAVVIGEAPSGKLIFANEKINEVWGHPMKASENIGEYIQWIGFHPDGSQYQGHEWPLARSIQFGEIVNDEDVDIMRGDGKPAVLRLSSAPIRDNFGKIIAGVVISQDVTQLKQAIRGRDEFLSIASHELKTPLTTLSASIQILMRVYEKEPGAKTIPQLINTSYNSTVKLATLVRELLNVSKIESGQLTLSKSTFNLAKLINECCTHVRLEGTHELLIEGDLTLEVFADQQRIDQVIVNFVNNAVKYSPDSPDIRLLIEKKDSLAKVSVIDKGIGVEPDKLPHLFERYYRVDPSGVQYSGLGLGLYISSEIIKLHKGEVGVSSDLGQGSSFWFTIPIDGASSL